MILNDFPWAHAVIDDLIDPVFQDRLARFVDLAQQKEEFGLYHFGPTQFGQDVQDLYLSYLKQLQHRLPDMLTWFTRYRTHDQLELTSHVAVQPRDYIYRPHCDHPDKILSIISYVAPEHSRGTCLHATESSPASVTIDWLPGRTLIFAGGDDVTWHSYGSGPCYRATLCSFFIRPGPDPSR